MKVNSKWIKVLGIILGVVVVAITLSITPTTMSYFTDTDNVINPVDLGKVDIEVDEDFTPPQTWDGTNYDKVVRIENVGTKHSLIRVAVIPRWENPDGTPFAGDVSLLSITFSNTNLWLRGADGYFYYTAKVPSGMSTEAVMASVTFQPDIPSEILARYEGKKLIVDVKAEAVLASEEAYEAVWSQMSASSDPVNAMLRNLITTP